MSPDKAHTVTLAAVHLYSSYGKEEAVKRALELYDEAVRQVRASGPTSTEVECKRGKGTICCDFDCPRHGHG